MRFLKSVAADRHKYQICIVNLIILFYLFRSAIPIFKYPFILLYVGLLVYSAIIYKKRIIPTLVEFSHNYFLLLILGLILAISFLFSNKLYLTIFKDVVNMFILLSIFFILTLIISGRKELHYFVSSLTHFIVFFAFLISISSFLDLLNITSYKDFSQLDEVASKASENLTSIDYNFALLPSIFAIIIILNILCNHNSKLQIICYNFLLVIFSFGIIFSGSRRGLIAFASIVGLLLVSQIFIFKKKDGFLKRLGVNSKYFLLTLFLLVTISSYITIYADYIFKNKVLELSGSKNLLGTKQKIAVNLYKYASIFGQNSSIMEFYSQLWSYIPEDPESGWGTRVHKTIFPLTGANVEIVPKGTKGYLMDSTCNASYYSSIDVSESYTFLGRLKVSKNDRCKASVFCFVSDSVELENVCLSVDGAYIDNKIVKGEVTSFYDFENKGIWQKLNIDFVCNENNGGVPLYMSFCKRKVKDFSKLKGYVIFAHPLYEKNNKSNNILPNGLTKGKSYNTGSGKIDYFNSNKIYKCNDSQCQIGETDHENILLGKTFDSRNNLKKNPEITFAFNSKQYSFSAIFCFPLSILQPSDSIKNDYDPIRNWTSKFVSEDTTYYQYRSNIVLDTVSNAFIGDRLLRWEFALKIFLKEYNWKQKLFGDGFNFLNWFGYYFDKDKTRSDYPHNPLLSVLLYSGVLGLILYLIFICQLFYYYFKYFKEYKIPTTFFLFTFFFSFFSAGSPFDPPIMGFFAILPFFFHYIHKKEKTSREIGALR